ncbi:MAG: indole-3-glycerol phosphate synthase TrpC [bacterium]|nr:indole-3-glycerol phosphate synthase TrpC [bacterium]
MNILEKILAHKKEELATFKGRQSLQDLKDRVRDCPDPLDFAKALRQPPAPMAVIAEIKKKSPSKGILRENFDPVALATDYEQHGAAALSVLTDESFFGGHLDHLRAVRDRVKIPLLRKDFIWDPYQLYAALEAGADAILLIVAMLEESQLEDLMGLALDMGLAVLVEVHDAAECDRAVHLRAPIIGVNNRDLTTFEVDLKTSESLFPKIPEGSLRISESGIESKGDLERLQKAGADGFLIGETFMRAENPGTALKELIQG